MRTHVLQLITGLCFFIASQGYAQVPSQCLEIESILVDACVPGSGCNNAAAPSCSCEGKNEMVRIKIGPANIPVSDLTISWPNNTFRGISPANATTASIVADLQSTVQSACGRLLEPPGAILPAGKNVLIISSTDMCVAANSFSTLSDTLYVIFQNAGNYQGHFANHDNGGTASPTPNPVASNRTLSIGRTSTSCTDVVTYNRSELVNIHGTYGGSVADNDGATVNFTWGGTPSYVNYGCRAPFEPLELEVQGPATACGSDPITVGATVTGNYNSFTWTGGTGSFANPGSLVTQYTPGTGDNGTVMLIAEIEDMCNGILRDTLFITMNPIPDVNITADGPLVFCQGGSVSLTASGGNNYVWSPGGSTSAFIVVTTSGTYTVTASNSCGSDQASVSVNVLPVPTAVITAAGPFCTGNSPVQLIATPSGGTWSGNGISISGVFNPATAGIGSHTINYQYTNSDNCTGTASTIIEVRASDVVQITAGGPTTFCAGENVTLTATGSSSYSWSNGQSGSSITVDQPGNYFAVSQGACADTSNVITVTVFPVSAYFTATPESGTPPLIVNFTNGSSNATDYEWSFGDGDSSTAVHPQHEFTQSGSYLVTLTAINAQGCRATYSLTIVVADSVNIVVPNVFSPNNDGSNDVYTLIALNISSLKMTIYNRWGQVMKVLDSPTATWNGEAPNGQKAAEGTYFYILEYTDSNGKNQVQNGHISLFLR